MVAIVSQDTAHARLQALETTSKRHLVDAANHWMAFRVIAQEIKDNELYKLSEHKTWHEYVRATWDIDSSKIRQYKMILPYANVLLEVLPSVTVEVETMKKLRQVVAHDNPLMPSVHNLGARVAHALGRPVRVSDLHHCLRVLEDNAVTNGQPSYGDSNMPFMTIEILEDKVYQEINEAKQRHIARLTPREKITGIPHAIQDVKTGLWYAALPMASHAVIIGKQTTFYIDKGK